MSGKMNTHELVRGIIQNDKGINTYCETPRCDLLLDILESVLSRAIKESSTKPIDYYFKNSIIKTIQQITFISNIIHNIRKFIDTGSVPALREVLYAVSKNEAGVFEWRNVFDMCVILGSEVQKLIDIGLFEPFENRADVEYVTVAMVDNFFTFLSSPDEEDLGVEFVMCLIRLLKLCELYPGANVYEKRFNNGEK